MVNLIQGPIPGQSLTDTPRNAPWERPAEIDTVEGAVEYYIKKLANQDAMDDISVLFELGGDLETITKTFVTYGAMQGLHTVEVGMLAGPVVASFIKVGMESYGIDVPETAVSFEEAAEEKELKRTRMLMEEAVRKAIASGTSESDPGVALLKEVSGMEAEEPAMDAEPEVEEPMPAEQPSAGSYCILLSGAA